jgi:integrase
MKKFVFKNNHIDCDKANEKIYDKLHAAHKLIVELGDSINSVDADTLVVYIRKAWDKKVDTKIRDEVDNGLTLSQWGKVIIDRKLRSNKPGTASRRTKKKAISKMEFIKIRDVNYKEGSPVWHAKNYALVMFNCRGMNFIDLVKLQVKDITKDRIFYGRSKTGDQLSVRITEELREILNFYMEGKSMDDYLFPANYDGSTKHYEKYKSLRRRMNGHLKTIAKDAGIEEHFTTYTIRHSWATIAKFMGISTEVISEGLGHNSLKTTQIYLKSFTNQILDEANEMVVT